MKELSVEQKARRYDEVVAMAKECITYIPDEEVNKYMFDMFPELKESEGERTRKELINFVKSHLAGFPQCEKYIAWLEKQGEQKPVDKVEPKFKIGDWIVEPREGEPDGLWHIDRIEDGYYWSDKCGCTIEYADKNFHLWTIQDAKDGDVLCYKDEISLYKHDIKNCTKQEPNFGGFVYYCCYDGKRFIMDSLYSLIEQDKMDIHPATKEQRDLLFQKIKEWAMSGMQ